MLVDTIFELVINDVVILPIVIPDAIILFEDINPPIKLPIDTMFNCALLLLINDEYKLPIEEFVTVRLGTEIDILIFNDPALKYVNTALTDVIFVEFNDAVVIIFVDTRELVEIYEDNKLGTVDEFETF
jgi:hypothetical protein